MNLLIGVFFSASEIILACLTFYFIANIKKWYKTAMCLTNFSYRQKRFHLYTALLARVPCASSTPNQKAQNTMYISLQRDNTDKQIRSRFLYQKKGAEIILSSKMIFLLRHKNLKCYSRAVPATISQKCLWNHIPVNPK